MKSTKYYNEKLQHGFKNEVRKLAMVMLTTLLAATAAHAVTRTWDGGTGGTGTEIGTAANWSGDTLPNVNGDVAQWDGTVVGNLVLNHGTVNFAGSSGNAGVSLNLAATQTGSLSIDSGANTSAIRLNNITIASGAGAFTFGNGTGTFNLTIGGAAGTRTYQNDSANTATLASDLTLNTGGAGIQTFAFAGTGNWIVNCNLAGGNQAGNSVTKSGAGNLTIGGANTYTGTTTVSAGALTLSGSGTIGATTSALTISGGAADLGGLSRTNGTVTLTSGTLSNGTMQASTLTANNTVEMTVPARLVGTAALAKTGAGTLILNSATANTYSGGTTIGAAAGAAVLRAASTQALGTGTVQTDSTGNASTARLEVTNGISLSNAITLFGRNNSSVGIQSLGGNNTLSGTITVSSGGSVYQIQSDANTLTLGTAAATAISAASGSRIVTLQGASNGSVVGNIVNGGGTVGITKAGAGAWTLSGVNSCTGVATVSQGTLALSGTATLSAPQISIASGAIFDVSGLSSTFTIAAGQVLTNGTGTVSGNVATAAASSAAIYPAAAGAAGTLTFNNNLNLGAGGSVYFDLSTTYNSGNDQIVVGGNLTLSSSDAIHISALSGAANLDTTVDYVLFAVTGTTTIASQPSLVWDGAAPTNSANFSLTTSGNNVVLRYSSATAPAVTAGANPASPTRNQPVLITAIVAPGSSNIASVTVDASAIGGSPTTSLVLSNNFIYTNTVSVSSIVTTGAKSLTVIVSDDSVPTPLTGGYTLGLTVVVGNKTWDGGALADDNWTSNANWQNDVGPALTNDSVTFAGSTRLTPSMDASFSVAGLTFDNTAGGFTLGTSGGTLTLTAGLTNNSASAQTVNVPISLPASQSIHAAGDITINGAVSGAGGVTKTGNGTLTLTANNGFSGNLFGKAGAVVLDSGKINTGGNYCSVGVDTGDNATLTLQGAGAFTNSNDFNVGDIGSSVGTLNVANSASLKVGSMYVASANAAASTASGTVNQSGGVVANTSLVIGGRGTGSTNGVGVYNLSGGSLISSGTLRAGGTGTGTLNISGTGTAAFAATTESYVGYRSGTGTVSMVSGNLSVAGELRVGGSDANGATMDAVGAVTVSNATMNVGALTIARGNFLDNACAGTVTLKNGGTLVNTNDVIVQYAGTGLGKLVIDGGNFIVGPAAARWFEVGTWDAGAGRVDVPNGSLSLWNGSSIKMCMQNNTGGNVFNQVGGNVTFYSDAGSTVGGIGQLDLNYNQQNNASSTSTYNLSGGVLTVPQIIATKTTGTSTFNFNGGTLKAAASSTTFMQGLTAANVQSSGAIIDTDGKNITIAQALLDGGGGGGLTKNGNGSLVLDGVNAYTGLTTVNGGALGGTGSLAGGLTVGASGTLAAGNSIGTFTINGAATLNGTVVAEITNGPSADLINFAGGATLGGTLTVVANGTLTSGQTFNLFDGSLSGMFSTVNLPGGPAHWNTSALYTAGELTYANANPVANNFSIGVAVGGSATVPAVGKYVSDADGDAVTITSVSIPASGTATIIGGTNITYTSTATAGSDSFTYTVSDGLGGTDTKTVSVTISSPEGFNRLSGPVNNGNGTLTIDYLGLPNANYALDTTASLIPPVAWTPVVTNTAAGNGALSFTFPTGDSQGFFRTRYVP